MLQGSHGSASRIRFFTPEHCWKEVHLGASGRDMWQQVVPDLTIVALFPGRRGRGTGFAGDQNQGWNGVYIYGSVVRPGGRDSDDSGQLIGNESGLN